MSEVRLVIRDRERDISGICHGSIADVVVGALAAEPETIEELDIAMERFRSCGELGNFASFTAGILDQSYDAGIVIVDLAARLIVSQSTYSAHTKDGFISYHDDEQNAEIELRYHVAEDWELTAELEGWRENAEQRRRNRSGERLDARAILYGRQLHEFLARECFEAFVGIPLAPADPSEEDDYEEEEDDEDVDFEESLSGEFDDGYNAEMDDDFDDSLDDDFEDDELEDEDLNLALDEEDDTPESQEAAAARRKEYATIADIHARWLMIPREDLRNREPRDILLEKRSQITWDLQDRAEQWSQTKYCPRGLDPESTAYRFGGCGTHEVVVYYDMIRYLLESCRESVAASTGDGNSAGISVNDFLATEVDRLGELQNEWLDERNEEFGGRTPRAIIHRERVRVPEGGKAHETMADCDCPLCAMQAESSSPAFWGLDGYGMDEDFAFTFFRTRQEWEEEEQRQKAFNERYQQLQAVKENLGVTYPGGGWANPNYVWKRSFVRQESSKPPIPLRLFAFGSNLAELIVDIKSISEDREFVDRINRDFVNLREVAGKPEALSSSSLVAPVLHCFCETLESVAVLHEELREKCADLQARLHRFFEPPTEADDGPEDFDTDPPF